MSLLTELKCRNVFRVAPFYIMASWVMIQVAETVQRHQRRDTKTPADQERNNKA